MWSYAGKVVQKLKGHKGKSIWSLCIKEGMQQNEMSRTGVKHLGKVQLPIKGDNQKSSKEDNGDKGSYSATVVFTGGGDNSIRMWSVDQAGETTLQSDASQTVALGVGTQTCTLLYG